MMVKYHLAMLHKELAMSEERTTYQQAERQVAVMNQITVFHSSPSDFLHTQEESKTKQFCLIYKNVIRRVAASARQRVIGICQLCIRGIILYFKLLYIIIYNNYI